MKRIFIGYIYIILTAIPFFSCKKGTPLPETTMVGAAVSKLFKDSPAMEVYIDGQLLIQLGVGETAGSILLPRKNAPVQISIKKKEDQTLLGDTTFPSLNTDISLTYMYNEQLGFNQFVGPDFKRPAADSISLQFSNQFDYGSHKQNVYVYKSPDGLACNPMDLLDSVVNIDFNKIAPKIILLPAYEADGVTPINYCVVNKDAVTGYNGVFEYLNIIGLDPQLYGGYPLTGPNSFGFISPGKLTIVKIMNYPYDENGVHYEQLLMDKLFEY